MYLFNNNLIGLFLFVLVGSCHGQELEFKEIKKLNYKVKENSGIVVYNNTIYTHNDSGDGPYIYHFSIDNPDDVKKTKLDLADNTDWEDITFDGENLYVFDTGTNNKKRKKMTYYQIPIRNLVEGEIPISDYKEVNFKFKDKNGKTERVNCEAAAFLDGELIFMTKNNSLKTEIYTMKPGESEAQFHAKIKLPFEITGMAAADGKVYFCGYNKLGDNIYFSKIGSMKKSPDLGWNDPIIKIYEGKFNGQCEGIFVDNDIVYLSTEQNLIAAPKLYQLESKNLK